MGQRVWPNLGVCCAYFRHRCLQLPAPEDGSSPERTLSACCNQFFRLLATGLPVTSARGTGCVCAKDAYPRIADCRKVPHIVQLNARPTTSWSLSFKHSNCHQLSCDKESWQCGTADREESEGCRLIV